MTSKVFVFDHYMGDGYTVTRTVKVGVRRGAVVEHRYGKSRVYRARFPRLLAWRIARQLRREGYTRAAA